MSRCAFLSLNSEEATVLPVHLEVHQEGDHLGDHPSEVDHASPLVVVHPLEVAPHALVVDHCNTVEGRPYQEDPRVLGVGPHSKEEELPSGEAHPSEEAHPSVAHLVVSCPVEDLDAAGFLKRAVV